METIVIGMVCAAVGFIAGMLVTAFVMVSDELRSMEEKPQPPTIVIRDDPQTLAALAESQTTARFYQELFLDEQRMKA